MINKKIISYLQKIELPHQVLSHKKVYTAYDKAQTLNARLEEIVKALIVKADAKYHLALLPANQTLDLKKVAKVLKAKQVKIVGEKAMLNLLSGQPHALHAFASLYNFPLLVEKSLANLKEVILPSGSFEESLKVKTREFLTKELAILATIGSAKKLPKPAKVKKVAKKKVVKKVAKKSTKKTSQRKKR